ncbi:MAG: hypothetical protein E7Z80_03560 [Methanobrevibacter thaueri]|nr:hypothetical protein [Methanobrevibacter thaueri]
MNKKVQYQILLIILVIIVIINLSIIIGNVSKNDGNIYNVTKIGGNANGKVYKIIAGDNSSNETVGIILGVHPREHEIHEAINKTIYDITQDNSSQFLNKKYVIYYIKTKSSITSHDATRAAGEELANKFIVPNIIKDDPFIVVDVHEINPEYEYSNFIFTLSDRNDKVDSYISKIVKDVGVVDFEFDEGTSPKKVTKPIANSGIDTFLMEVDITSNLTHKQHTAEKLIKSLDSLSP